MARQAFLHVDLVLAALIGDTGIADAIIARAERGEDELVTLELALYYTFCSVRNEDKVNLERFARLLRHLSIAPSPKPFEPPTAEDVEHWRAVALGREQDL